MAAMSGELLSITEQRHPRSTSIDTLSSIEIAQLINQEDTLVASAVATQLETIALVIDHVVAAWAAGGRLIYVGAGTSGRLGVLDASECPPTYNSSPDQVQGLIAGGHAALVTSAEEIEDDASAGRRDVGVLNPTAADVVIGIAASGSTPYVVGALQAAREAGSVTVALVAHAPSPVSDGAHFVINPRTGPEIVTGSTRMKAGTAQKMVLNMVSTAAMIRSGKTYGNLMVDLRATNTKLRRRAARIVAMATELDQASATAALALADGDVKTAIVASLLSTSPNDARRRLARVHGHVRRALEDNGAPDPVY